MIESVVGKITAALAPMTNRIATSADADVTAAPMPLDSANPARPMSSAGRRPNRSPSEPAVSTRAANARL
jgi:hypothetical protein